MNARKDACRDGAEGDGGKEMMMMMMERERYYEG